MAGRGGGLPMERERGRRERGLRKKKAVGGRNAVKWGTVGGPPSGRGEEQPRPMSDAALCRRRFSSCCTTTRPPAHFLTRSHRSASPSQGRAAPRGTRAARRPPAEPAPPWRPGQAPPGQEHPLATPSLPLAATAIRP
ncbi:hypothetical protein PVAP13_9NG494200 [Panicum virgatum]|uniref:Uncharacterized protein n=1 Tax=Panicum virgatum TaxID=38727 RepID=A0A8T0MYB9_PANVG|nr:hypothetical protein PVAP13_9NG494200 [Panicum virgatum]